MHEFSFGNRNLHFFIISHLFCKKLQIKINSDRRKARADYKKYAKIPRMIYVAK